MGGLTNLYGDSSTQPNGGSVVSELFEFETAATNLATYSADFSNAAWIKSLGAVVTPNTTLAPNAVVEADTITGGDTVQTGIAISNTNIFFCLSLYITAGTSTATYIQLLLSGVTNKIAAMMFNPVTGQILLDGNIIPAQVTLVSILGVSWFRVSLIIRNTSLNNFAEIMIRADANTNNKSIIVWGAQLESSTVNVNLPSSPIPTSAAAVARTGGIIAPWLLGSGGALPAVPGAGLILRSNGTNWTASQSTYPDIVGSKQILVASAANTVASFANFKYDDTAAVGMVLNNLLDISGAAGGQIKFPATANPSANANTLDDYEEGTWTAGIAFGGLTTGITYAANGQGGTYTKIGDRTFVDAQPILTSKGSAIGAATITGLPFAAGSGANRQPAISLGYCSPMTATTAQPMGYVSGSTLTSITLVKYSVAAGTNTTLADTDFTNTTDIIMSGVYGI